MNHPSPPEKMNARRRRASTYITRRFHRPGTLAAPDQSPIPQTNKTNPIPPGQLPKANAQQPKNAKQTQSTPQPHPNTRNKPNLRTGIRHRRTVPQFRETNPISTYRWRLAGFSSPNYAKQTQFAPPPPSPRTKKHETNPISTAADRWKTKNAKQTQFAPPSTIHNIQYTIPWPNPTTTRLIPV